MLPSLRTLRGDYALSRHRLRRLSPWLRDDLLFEPPTTSSLGYVQTGGPASNDDDHATIFPAFSEQDESSAMDPKIKSWVFGYTVILYSVYVPISYFYD